MNLKKPQRFFHFVKFPNQLLSPFYLENTWKMWLGSHCLSVSASKYFNQSKGELKIRQGRLRNQ